MVFLCNKSNTLPNLTAQKKTSKCNYSPRTVLGMDGGTRVSNMLDDPGNMSACLDLALKQETETEGLRSNFLTIHNAKHKTIQLIKQSKP